MVLVFEHLLKNDHKKEISFNKNSWAERYKFK